MYELFAGGMRETQDVMDFCAKNSVRPNVKVNICISGHCRLYGFSLRVFTVKETHAALPPSSLWLQEKYCCRKSPPDDAEIGKLPRWKLQTEQPVLYNNTCTGPVDIYVYRPCILLFSILNICAMEIFLLEPKEWGGGMLKLRGPLLL